MTADLWLEPLGYTRANIPAVLARRGALNIFKAFCFLNRRARARDIKINS